MEADPVVKEYKVFLSTQLAQYLHIIQTPNKTSLPSSNGGVLAGRYKKGSKLVELDVPLDTRHPTYSRERGEDLAVAAQTGAIKVLGSGSAAGGNQILSKVTLVGGPVSRLNAKYFVALKRDDAFHLTPVSNAMQLRPVLTYLDDMDAKTKASTKKMADMDKPAQAEVTKAIQVQFRKKETEEQLQARLNSYTYLKRQVDEEPWIHLSHFSRECEEAARVGCRLYCEGVDTLIFKPLDEKEYLEQILK